MSTLNIEVLCLQVIWLQYMYVYEREVYALCTFELNRINGGRGNAPEKAKAH